MEIEICINGNPRSMKLIVIINLFDYCLDQGNLNVDRVFWDNKTRENNIGLEVSHGTIIKAHVEFVH